MNNNKQPTDPFSETAINEELQLQLKRAQLNQEIQLLQSRYQDAAVRVANLKARLAKKEKKAQRAAWREMRAKETGDRYLNTAWRFVIWPTPKVRTSNPQTMMRAWAMHQVTWSLSGLIVLIPAVVIGRKWYNRISSPEEPPAPELVQQAQQSEIDILMREIFGDQAQRSKAKTASQPTLTTSEVPR